MRMQYKNVAGWNSFARKRKTHKLELETVEAPKMQGKANKRSHGSCRAGVSVRLVYMTTDPPINTGAPFKQKV